MVHLEEVDLSENEVIFFSPSFSKLPLLTTLNLSKNCKSVMLGMLINTVDGCLDGCLDG